MSKQPRPNLKALVAGNSAPVETAEEVNPPESPVAPESPVSGAVVQFQPQPEPVIARQPRAITKKAGQGRLRERTKQQSLYLEEAAYEQLRELSFHERKPMHSLVLEGLDLLFKKRGLKSLAQLTKSQDS